LRRRRRRRHHQRARCRAPRRAREHLLRAGRKRADLHLNDARHKHLTFHDLRATGITWAALRGDDPLKIKQRAGRSTFRTTEGYIREA
jgi:hypothetical protein